MEEELRSYVFAMKEVGDTEVWPSVIGVVEKVLLKLALESCNGNQLKASELLGINRNTIRKKLTDHQLDPTGFKNGS